LFSFFIIRLREEFGSFLFILFCLIDIFSVAISVLIFQSGLSLSTYSADYIKIAKRSYHLKEHTTFFRSCQPIAISVGGLFTVSSKDFCLHIFVTVVFQNTINLLLTF